MRLVQLRHGLFCPSPFFLAAWTWVWWWGRHLMTLRMEIICLWIVEWKESEGLGSCDNGAFIYTLDCLPSDFCYVWEYMFLSSSILGFFFICWSQILTNIQILEITRRKVETATQNSIDLGKVSKEKNPHKKNKGMMPYTLKNRWQTWKVKVTCMLFMSDAPKVNWHRRLNNKWKNKYIQGKC